MLMAARSLLESSGPELTGAADALTVAKKVLNVQDTVELVLAALCIEAGSSNKLDHNLTFHDLVGFIVKNYGADDDDEARNQKRECLNSLNHARVRFKHHGDLLDATTTYPLVAQAIQVTSDLCFRAVGISLQEVDAIAAIAHVEIAQYLRDADEAMTRHEYRAALESTARAVTAAFWEYNVPPTQPGAPDAELALLLSGRGVDPASFLAMRRFLPTLYSPTDEEPKFDTRKYGHEVNWTPENTRFCWNTALTLALRLQHALPIPDAIDFYSVYEDVVTVKATKTVCERFTMFGILDSQPAEMFSVRDGEVFTGHAVGFWTKRGLGEEQFSIPYVDASWIKLTLHNLAEGGLPYLDELWFKASDVEVSYREHPNTVLMKKYLSEQMGI